MDLAAVADLPVMAAGTVQEAAVGLKAAVCVTSSKASSQVATHTATNHLTQRTRVLDNKLPAADKHLPTLILTTPHEAHETFC